MNVTLSVDRDLLEKTRAYAERHGRSLNQLLRDYMEQLIGAADAADEFVRLVKEGAGHAEAGFRFERDVAHHRSRR